MKQGTPASSTAAAASGSCHTLNSATAVALPMPADPPMKTMRAMFAATSGYVRSSRARFVCGARATIVTGSGCSRISRRSIATAPPGSGTRALSGSSIPARPSSPCT